MRLGGAGTVVSPAWVAYDGPAAQFVAGFLKHATPQPYTPVAWLQQAQKDMIEAVRQNPKLYDADWMAFIADGVPDLQ